MRRLIHSHLNVVILLVVGVLVVIDSHAQIERLHEIQAAFVLQFTNYIEWPDQGLDEAPKDATFVISVAGKSPLFEKLTAVTAGKLIKGRKVEVYANPGQEILKKSRIVVVSEADSNLLPGILTKTEGESLAIITHGAGLAQRGATINFFVENGKLRFEINRTSAEKRGLQLSSQLLKLARIAE